MVQLHQCKRQLSDLELGGSRPLGQSGDSDTSRPSRERPQSGSLALVRDPRIQGFPLLCRGDIHDIALLNRDSQSNLAISLSHNPNQASSISALVCLYVAVRRLSSLYCALETLYHIQPFDEV